MPFKGIPRGSVYIRSAVPCIFGIKYGTPFKELELPYKRDDIERQKYCNHIMQGKHHIIKCILKYFIINIQTRPVTQ